MPHFVIPFRYTPAADIPMSYGAVILAITLGFSGLGEKKNKLILRMMASTNLRTPMKPIDFNLFLT